MANRSRKGSRPIDMNEIDEPTDGQVAEVMRIVAGLDYPELVRLRDLIVAECDEKAEAAKANLIAETQRKFEQLGLSFDEVMATQKKRQRKERAPAVPKYRSPEGREWSGRGPIPKWIRELEEAGGNREDYLIKEEG